MNALCASMLVCLSKLLIVKLRHSVCEYDYAHVFVCVYEYVCFVESVHSLKECMCLCVHVYVRVCKPICVLYMYS